MDIVQQRIRTLESAQVRKPMNDVGAACDGIDRISSLPNEILCHILSLLPTKYAVATSILSTRWRNLFPLIPNPKIKLDDSLYLHPELASDAYPVSFGNFVDRLLNVTLHGVPSIHSFSLILQKFDDGEGIANWIHAALHLNAKRMVLQISELTNPDLLLDSLFGCNLVSLNLSFDFDYESQNKISLPNLKTLCVQDIRFYAVTHLVEGCPSLECLVVCNCYTFFGELLWICHPSLKTLKLVNGIDSLVGDFKLDLPNLEYLSYDGFLSNNFEATEMNSLRTARLNLEGSVGQHPYDFDEPEAQLVQACSGAGKLWLSGKFVKILYHYPPPLPQFQKLVHVAIKNMDYYGWEMLPSLVDSAPELTNVTLKSGFDDESYKRFKASVKESCSICLSQQGTSFVLKIQRNAA